MKDGKTKGKVTTLAILMSIVVVIVVASIFIARRLKTDPIEKNLEEDQMIRTLFVISDGNRNVLTTNLLVYYPVSKKAFMLNIAGNTGRIWNSIGRVDRIDVIYNEMGMATYCEEIEKLTDMKIPFTIDLNINDLGILADLFGGLNVLMDGPVDVKDDYGNRYLLPPGAVLLDGSKVKSYAMYREPEESVFKQNVRRENLFIAFLKALNENKSILENKKSFRQISKYFTTNIDQDGLKRLLREVSNIDSEKLNPQEITGGLRTVEKQVEGRVEKRQLLFPEDDARLVKEVVKSKVNSLLVGDEETQTRVYVVAIKNGTNVQGLAHNTNYLLSSAGYNILSESNYIRNGKNVTDLEHTLIINHIGNEVAAKTFGDFIQCYNIENEEVLPESSGFQSAAEVDFTLILGKDFDGRYVRGGYGRKTE